MGIKSISAMLDVSRNIVKRYVRIYQESGVPLNKFLSMSGDHLQNIFCSTGTRSPHTSERQRRLEELLPTYVKRLKVRGTTRKMLYDEYSAANPEGYNYTSFCRYIKKYGTQIHIVGHVEHKAGDQMYIDFAGDKLHMTDVETGETKDVEVFLAILPCSQYLYCEAVGSQRKEDLIRACENALHFFGGSPMAIVPDNLKSAVTKADRFEPVISNDFASFAEHYGCVVFPARVRKPKDKAHVENAVRLVYREIYLSLKGKEYNSLIALNSDIRKALKSFNDKSFIASPIEYQACKSGIRTYANVKLRVHLKLAKNKGNSEQEMRKIERTHLLILDDLFLVMFDATERALLIEIIEDRHGRKSTILTS